MEQLEHVLNPNLCGYRKGFSTQHALISMLEKWKQQLDKKGYAGAVLMDLSKAFEEEPKILLPLCEKVLQNQNSHWTTAKPRPRVCFRQQRNGRFISCSILFSLQHTSLKSN